MPLFLEDYCPQWGLLMKNTDPWAKRTNFAKFCDGKKEKIGSVGIVLKEPMVLDIYAKIAVRSFMHDLDASFFIHWQHI